jgi:hypothetical protein
MTFMKFCRTLQSTLLAATFVAVFAGAPAQARPESSAAARPTVMIVKRALTKTWDRDRENSVDNVTLTFRSLRLATTRRAIPADSVEGAWVTPVSVIDQKIVTLSPNILTGGTDRYCLLYRVNFAGIFWKGDYGWTFKNRNVTTKRISSNC